MQKIPVGLFIIKSGVLLWCNAHFGELVELPPEQVAGKGFVGFIAPEDRPFVLDRYKRRLAGEQVPDNYEFSIVGATTGRLLPVHMVANIAMMQDETYSIGVIVDVTAQAQIAAGLVSGATASAAPMTPVLRVAPGVLVVPLVGHYHAGRVQVLMQDILAAIQQQGARVLVIDVTGLIDADMRVADYLSQTAAAARLVGARCLLAGVSPALARILVESSGALEGLETRATLEAALRSVGVMR
jgi:PAS domain S-box-containing protein